MNRGSFECYLFDVLLPSPSFYVVRCQSDTFYYEDLYFVVLFSIFKSFSQFIAYSKVFRFETMNNNKYWKKTEKSCPHDRSSKQIVVNLLFVCDYHVSLFSFELQIMVTRAVSNDLKCE